MVIIYGYSKIAAEISYRIHKDGKKLILIEDGEEKKFALIDKFYDKFYEYNCFKDEELIEVGVKDSDLKSFFCLSNDFNKNLFVTLSVRNINKNLQIIALSHNEEEETKLKLAGADAVINPYKTTATKIFRFIHRADTDKILDKILYHDKNLNFKEIIVAKDTILENVKVKDTDIFDKYNIILIGIQDKELSKDFIFTSRGINHKIDEGDVLVVLGRDEDIKKFELEVMGGICEEYLQYDIK